jgi:hypothetical protein
MKADLLFLWAVAALASGLWLESAWPAQSEQRANRDSGYERTAVERATDDDRVYFGIDDPEIEHSLNAGTPWLVVLSPAGGEEWCVGSTHEVTWSCFEISSVKIDYGMTVGSDWLWVPIISSTPAAPGSYPWTIPDRPGSGRQVRVCALPYQDPCDVGGFFAIIYCSPGDVTGDGIVDLADLIYVLNYIYKGGNPPDPMADGDVNADCIVDLADVVYLINYLFKEGNPPLVGCA